MKEKIDALLEEWNTRIQRMKDCRAGILVGADGKVNGPRPAMEREFYSGAIQELEFARAQLAGLLGDVYENL